MVVKGIAIGKIRYVGKITWQELSLFMHRRLVGQSQFTTMSLNVYNHIIPKLAAKVQYVHYTAGYFQWHTHIRS